MRRPLTSVVQTLLAHVLALGSTTVTEGALVRLSGRYFVIAVSTSKFICDGREVMGISTMAPIFEAIGGARAGETVEFNGRKLVIEDVA
jgi:hypothetical protein